MDDGTRVEEIEGRPSLRLLGLGSDAPPAQLAPDTVRALNEKVAIIRGLAQLLLTGQKLDPTARAALECIARQASGVRELFLKP